MHPTPQFYFPTSLGCCRYCRHYCFIITSAATAATATTAAAATTAITCTATIATIITTATTATVNLRYIDLLYILLYKLAALSCNS